jgi:hypothetical protein
MIVRDLCCCVCAAATTASLRATWMQPVEKCVFSYTNKLHIHVSYACVSNYPRVRRVIGSTKKACAGDSSRCCKYAISLMQRNNAAILYFFWLAQGFSFATSCANALTRFPRFFNSYCKASEKPTARLLRVSASAEAVAQKRRTRMFSRSLHSRIVLRCSNASGQLDRQHVLSKFQRHCL